MDLYWQKVEDALIAAPEIPEAGRESWIAEFCDGDEELKAEIESLLSLESDAGNFLEKSVGNYIATVFSADETDFAGKDFGHYKIIREIGRGGMGAVFLAERADGEFDQLAALKILQYRFAGSELSKRFRRERQILANLNHPNIARLLDGGVSSENESYIVMEYVEGERIDEYCGKHNLSTNERLKLYLSVCAAVAYAHQHLIVHRDIKPSNILVTEDGVPKLLDFGIAKLIDADHSEEDTQTAFRAFTPKYASPEQISGGQITTAADVYSLGVLLEEILSEPHCSNNGQVIFADSETSDENHTNKANLTTDPDNQYRQAKNSNSIDSELKNILAMAQREEPERRYASVQQFAEDIERYLNGLTVRAQKASFKYRAGKFIKRNRLAAAAASVILLSLLGGLTVSLWQYRNAERQRVKAEKINHFLENMLESANPNYKNLHGQNDPSDFAAMLDDVSKQLENEDLASQPEMKSHLQQIIGSSYLSIGKYDPAERNLRAALETQDRLYGEDNQESIKSLVGLAAIALVRSNYEEAESLYRKCLKILRANYENGNIDITYLLQAMNDFAVLRRAQGDSKEAESLLREIIPLKPDIVGNAKIQMEVSETVLTLTLTDQGKFDEASRRQQDQAAEIKKHSNPDSPELSSALTMLGSIEMETGENAKAEESLKQAEAIYRKIYDPHYMAIYDNLRLQAQNFYLQGKFAEAEKTIDLVLENYKLNSSPKYLNYATALTVKGLILNKEGNPVEAEKVLREAVRLREENLPKEHFMSALTTGALGEILVSQKRFAEAEPLLLESYKNLRSSQAVENPRTTLAKNRLYDLYTTWGKPEVLAVLH